MRLGRIISTAVKELLQMSRDRKLYPLLLLAPTLQIIILGYAATFDIHNIPTAVLNRDGTPLSREYVRRFSHNGYFSVDFKVQHRDQIYQLLDRGRIKVGI